MRVNGYGVRPGNNGYSGQQRSGDEYNRDVKRVRYTRAEEYATRNTKEYHHYPEQKDLTKEDDDDKQQDSSQNNNNQNSAKNAGRSGLQAIQQIVVAIAGAAVVATSYTTAMAAKRAQKQVEDPTASVSQTADNDAGEEAAAASASWEWSDDFASAVLILKDSAGNIIAKVPANITTLEEPAGCTTTGKIIYTAAAEADGTSYTDTREKETPARGHAFDDGTQTVLENGKSAVDFECTRCGEHFKVQNSLEEE